jgi:hypothetical protein
LPGARRTTGWQCAAFFIGDDDECFHRAAVLSLKVNFETIDVLSSWAGDSQKSADKNCNFPLSRGYLVICRQTRNSQLR